MRTDARWLWLLGILLFLGLAAPAFTQPGHGEQGEQPPVPATATASSAEARAALQRVLARREFRENRITLSPGQRNALQEALAALAKGLKNAWSSIEAPFKALGRWLKRIFERAAPATTWETPSVSPTIGLVLRYLFFIILAAAVLYLLGIVVTRVLVARKIARAPEKLDDFAADPSTRRKLEPTFWEQSLKQAEALWQQGNQREALRILYRACLVLMDARGILRYDETRANGEVLRELRRQGQRDVQQALQPIVRTFDRSWYGYLPVSVDEFTTAMDRSREFRLAVVERRHE